LSCFCDGGVWLDLESLARSESKDGTRGGLAGLASASWIASLFVEICFDLAPDGLGAEVVRQTI